LVCDGAGNCGDDSVDCGPNLCDDDKIACATSCNDDDDCDSDGYCVQGGTCDFKQPDGETCSRAAECESGHCVDGVCCNTACAGQCEACAQSGAEGKCVAVVGEPVGDREACEEAPDGEPCLARSCDGETRTECAGYAGADVVCRAASCDESGQTPEAVCDGSGACAVAEPVSCGAYLCDAAGEKCADSCTSDADCSLGNSCVEGTCGTGARCSLDGADLVEPNMNRIPCAPYRCQGTACLDACDSSDDCASGFVCNRVNGKCETAQSATSQKEDSGCGCRSVRRTQGHPLALVLIAGLLGLARRRAWRRPRATAA
jgi:hypothetical protein